MSRGFLGSLCSADGNKSPVVEQYFHALIYGNAVTLGVWFQLQRAGHPNKTAFLCTGSHQTVGVFTPCANLKILCVQVLTAAYILGNIKTHIRIVSLTGLQFQIGCYPTDNMNLCHSSPFCL